MMGLSWRCQNVLYVRYWFSDWMLPNGYLEPFSADHQLRGLECWRVSYAFMMIQCKFWVGKVARVGWSCGVVSAETTTTSSVNRSMLEMCAFSFLQREKISMLETMKAISKLFLEGLWFLNLGSNFFLIWQLKLLVPTFLWGAFD